MACFWASECLPMAVTSLLPMVLCPLLGIVEADTQETPQNEHVKQMSDDE